MGTGFLYNGADGESALLFLCEVGSMTSVLPPSASEDDDYALTRKEPAESQHDHYVATSRRTGVPVFVAIAVALLVILGTVVIVMLVWGGQLL